MRVLVIDIDGRRREEICRLINSSGSHNAIPRESVFTRDVFWHEVPEKERPQQLAEVLKYDCLILHLSNSQKACKELLCHWLIPHNFGKLVILISGDLFSLYSLPEILPKQFDPTTWNPNAASHPPVCLGTNRNYYRFEQALSGTNAGSIFYIDNFLNEVELIIKENGYFPNWSNSDWDRAWSKLVAFNPLLEAKLELLHNLLVPPSNLAELENDDGLWTKLINLVGESKKSEIEGGWNTFKKGFNPNYSTEPFNSNYLKLLTDLRDALLPEHEYAK